MRISAFFMKHHFVNNRRLIQLFAVLLFCSHASLVATAQTSFAFQTGIENFGQINSNYYRGSQPDAKEFEELKRFGIRTVIDLRKDSLPEAVEWARSQGLRYFNIPLTTKKPATEEQTALFLKLVNDPNNFPVYVHCKGGRHRTGEMTAIYRITYDGWTADQSYQEMKKYDFESGLFGGPGSLKKYVFSYYQHYMTEKTNNASKAAVGN